MEVDASNEGKRRRGKLQVKVRGEGQMITRDVRGYKDSSDDEERAVIEDFGDEIHSHPPLIRLDDGFSHLKERKCALPDEILQKKILCLLWHAKA